jgi:hypothetical protein
MDRPRRKAFPYGSDGVEFRNGDSKTKFYDKYAETKGDSSAKGILRQEMTYRTRSIKSLLHKESPTLRDVTPNIVNNALTKELKIFHLDCLIANPLTAFKILCDEYGPLAGVFYFGLLQARMMAPSKKAIQIGELSHPKSLDRKLKKIVDANIALSLTDHKEPLPPLTIDNF